MLGGVGMTELLIIAGIAMLIFGPRQLPKLGKSLGESIRSFRDAGKELAGLHDDDKEDLS